SLGAQFILHDELQGTDLEPVSRADGVLLDTGAVDVSPVGAAEIFNEQITIPKSQAAVTAADGTGGNADIRAGATADERFRRAQFQDFSLSAAFRHHELDVHGQPN